MMNVKIPYDGFLPWGVCKFSEIKENLIQCRAKGRIPANSKSVIVYLFPYYLGEENYKNLNISKYAVPYDYHIIAGDYLEKAVKALKEQYPENSFEFFCDNSPVPEVRAATLSGVGVRGENGLLINEKYGSFCFIGEIVTDLEITSTSATKTECLKCGKCKKACPDSALGDGFCKEKCLSHLTQKKGELDDKTIKIIKKNECIWGCDICQNTCPMNENISVTPIKEFLESGKSEYKSGDDLEKRAYSWRGRDVIERNLKIICCNDEKNQL